MSPAFHRLNSSSSDVRQAARCWTCSWPRWHRCVWRISPPLFLCCSRPPWRRWRPSWQVQRCWRVHSGQKLWRCISGCRWESCTFSRVECSWWWCFWHRSCFSRVFSCSRGSGNFEYFPLCLENTRRMCLLKKNLMNASSLWIWKCHWQKMWPYQKKTLNLKLWINININVNIILITFIVFY